MKVNYNCKKKKIRRQLLRNDLITNEYEVAYIIAEFLCKCIHNYK